MRKHKVDEIHLSIENVRIFKNDRTEGFVIEWWSDIGFGEYTIYKSVETGMWYADSENMDSHDDKEFIQELMKLFIEKLVIR